MALSTPRPTPLDLARNAGRLPIAAAFTLAVACGGAAAQDSAAPVPGGNAPISRISVPGFGQPDAGQPAGGPQVRVSDHMTVDLHVKDEDLASVLELLSIQTQKNIIPSKSVSARVSATLYNVTFYEALDAILHVNGFGYIERGNFIYVYTLAEIDEIEKALSKRIAKVIHLSYLNAADAAEFVKPLLSPGGEIKTSAKTEDFSIPDTAPVGADSYALGATLVVIDYEQNIEAIEQLLSELDTKPAQVLVEATVLQTSLTEANAFGVDFSIIGDLNFTDFIGVGGPRRAADALVLGGSGQAPDGLSPADNRGTAVSSNPGNTEGRSTFKVGVIADDVSIFMKLLDEVSDTTIISNPKVLALNRMPARVLVGRRVGYLNTTSTETSTTQTVQFLDTGTQLFFRPFVGRDNSIRMELKPQVSEAIIRQAADATGAAVSIPDEVTQEITTNVIVNDGQTIVLGGLFRESTQFARRQVPFLGDIPVIGAAFRGHDNDTDRSEIIFMITPTIINDAIIDQAAQMVQADIERLRAGSRQGLLPWSRDKMTSIHNMEAEQFARRGEYEKALWHIQRSLALNPNQPEAFRLRERITGERERWPDRSLLDDAIGDETRRALDSIVPPDFVPEHMQPYGHHPVPRTPVAPPALRPPADPAAEPVSAAPAGETSMFLDPAIFDQNLPEFDEVAAQEQSISGSQPGDSVKSPLVRKSGVSPSDLGIAGSRTTRSLEPIAYFLIPQPQFSPWFTGLTSWNWSVSTSDFFTLNTPADQSGDARTTITNVPDNLD